MEFDVTETTTAPWRFPTINLQTGLPSSDIPILQYNGPNTFKRFSAFVQNTLKSMKTCSFLLETKLKKVI